MNYEAGTLEADDRLRLEGPEDDLARRRRRRWIIGAVVLVAVLALAWWAFAGGKPAPAPRRAAQQVPNVTVVVPGSRPIARVLSATGSLAARREMPVGVAGEGGMVTRVLVEPGQWVGAGQVLATVDRSVQAQTAESLAASIRVAQADAQLAQAQLDRARQLVDRGFISKADIDNRTATRDAANARVKVAQAQLAETRARNRRLDIRAPEAGLVLTRAVEPGQIVSSATGVLFRMAKGGEMEMRAQLAEADLVGLRPGARAVVTPVGSDQRFTGEVWQVSPVIDQQTRQGIARIALRYDPALRPGGFAAAQITSGAAVAPQLPNSAIQSDDRGNFVYVVGAGNKVERRAVTIGDVSDEGVVVTGGLRGDERVVQSAGAFLSAGQQIRPILAGRGG
jgi:RND family efflux transporter MFP subunit